MSAFFCYKDRQVWASNGQVEDLLVALIKFAPEKSRLLELCVDQYRGFYSGIGIFLVEAIENKDEVKGWKEAARQALDHIKYSKVWTEIGNKWMDDNYSQMINIVDL